MVAAVGRISAVKFKVRLDCLCRSLSLRRLCSQLSGLCQFASGLSRPRRPRADDGDDHGDHDCDAERHSLSNCTSGHGDAPWVWRLRAHPHPSCITDLLQGVHNSENARRLPRVPPALPGRRCAGRRGRLVAAVQSGSSTGSLLHGRFFFLGVCPAAEHRGDPLVCASACLRVI